MGIERASADGTGGLIYRATINSAPHGRKVIYHGPNISKKPCVSPAGVPQGGKEGRCSINLRSKGRSQA